MSFPTDFTQSSNKKKKNNQKTGAKKCFGRYNSNYTLPSIDMSTLGFEIFEDARCAICDGDLDPKQNNPPTPHVPQLCHPCQDQIAHLKLEYEALKREKREHQIGELDKAIEAHHAQEELKKVLSDGNRVLRGEIEVIERGVRVQEGVNAEVRRGRGEEVGEMGREG
ncbi:hypothetical protein EAF04_007799 [Stromatinia cepivora]|nr:hypothetical protein EAF04_007799 [Stromatinia cepivora]